MEGGLIWAPSRDEFLKLGTRKGKRKKKRRRRGVHSGLRSSLGKVSEIRMLRVISGLSIPEQLERKDRGGQYTERY